MNSQDSSSISVTGSECPDQVTIGLVCKAGPAGIGGLENHLDMLLRHVPSPSCSYSLVTGSERNADRSQRVRAYLRFVRSLVNCRCDAMHFQGFDRLQLLTLLLVARGRIPLVVTPHNGLAGIVNERSAVRRRVKRWADGLLFPALIRQHARIIALSPEERGYYLDRFAGCVDLVKVLPNPVGAQNWAPLLPRSARPRLLVLSRLDPAKRIDDLVSALALLPRNDVECDIAGPDCGAAAALQDQAKQVARTIRFHGPVLAAAKERLFENAAVVVVTTEAEGLSTVALEALARGIPVIASEGGARGLPAEGVYRYQFGSVAELASTIEHLLADGNLVEARQAARRASAGLVRYDGYAQALRSLYRLRVKHHRDDRTVAAGGDRRRSRTSATEHRPA